MARGIYRWTPRIPPGKIKRLYESDARGMLDAELLEEIGFTIYMRCIEGQEVMAAVHENRMKCRGCLQGSLSRRSNDPDEMITCPCGWVTSWGAYRRSTFAQNMCNGSADPFFREYIAKWGQAHDAVAKMRLVDGLIHQFHVQDQIPGRAVGVNIINGTNRQVADLIVDLAYGEGSLAAAAQKEAYLARANDWRRMLVGRLGGNTVTRRVGTLMGVAGSMTMPLDALVDRIAEVDAAKLDELVEECRSTK